MKRYRIITFLVLVLVSLVSLVGYKIYKETYDIISSETQYILIPKGADFSNVIEILDSADLIKNKDLFLYLAKKKNLTESRVIYGRYEITPNMNLHDLIDQLKIGDTCPITVDLRKVKTINEIAQILSQRLELDSQEFINSIHDSVFLKRIGFTEAEISGLFIPKTYEMYWGWGVVAIRDLFYEDYLSFWDAKRMKKAEKLNLTIKEVQTLASIVNKETYFSSEYAKIAGLYYNRLQKDMLLQSDPTIIYTIQKNEPKRHIRRVLYRDLKIDSPYNTYMYKGLPPGPISIPKAKVIDATLNLENHKYIFMCAQSNMGGKHAFAVTMEEHEENAMSYQMILDSLKINR